MFVSSCVLVYENGSILKLERAFHPPKHEASEERNIFIIITATPLNVNPIFPEVKGCYLYNNIEQ